MLSYLQLHYLACDTHNSEWTFRGRTLTDYELIYVTQGSGKLVTIDGIIHFKEGQLLLIPPKLEHDFCSDVLPFSFCCVHFSLLKEEDVKVGVIATCDEMGAPIIRGFGFQRNSEDLPKFSLVALPVPLITAVLPDSPLQQLLDRLLPMISDGDINRLSTITKLFDDILTLLIDIYQPHTPLVSHAQMLIGYLNQHYREPLSLADLSEEFHLHPVYICKLCRDKTGYSPMKYVTLQRISAAKGLIRYSHSTLEQIATAVGFYDLAHFSKTFSAYEGISPSKYRKLFL